MNVGGAIRGVASAFNRHIAANSLPRPPSTVQPPSGRRHRYIGVGREHRSPTLAGQGQGHFGRKEPNAQAIRPICPRPFLAARLPEHHLPRIERAHLGRAPFRRAGRARARQHCALSARSPRPEIRHGGRRLVMGISGLTRLNCAWAVGCGSKCGQVWPSQEFDSRGPGGARCPSRL